MKRLNEAGPSFTKVNEQNYLAHLQLKRDESIIHTPATMKKRKTYKINEIFYTIQGEGLYAGSAAVFIRFAACNLSCSWCDTEYNSGVMMEAKTILRAVEEMVWPGHPKVRPIIVCTGGEPSLQVDMEFAFVFKDWELTMETNGIKWKEAMGSFNTITVSPKGMDGWWQGCRFRTLAWIVFKLVYDPSNPDMQEMMEKVLKTPAKARYLQPLENQEDASTNVQDVIKIVQRDPRWRLSLQTHKVLGLR